MRRAGRAAVSAGPGVPACPAARHGRPRRERTVTLTVTAARVQPSLFDAGPGSRAVDWSGVRVRAQDSALEPTVAAGLDDLGTCC